MRYSAQQREWFAHWEKQLQELVVFLGRFPCMALPCDDGSKLRDFEVVKSKRRPKAHRHGSPKPCHFKVGKVSASRKDRPNNDSAWFVVRNARGNRVHKRCRPKPEHDAKLECLFSDRWCEERAQSLKPSSGPSGKERLDALRQRIAARASASSA